jgi:hypothetical protein
MAQGGPAVIVAMMTGMMSNPTKQHCAWSSTFLRCRDRWVKSTFAVALGEVTNAVATPSLPAVLR